MFRYEFWLKTGSNSYCATLLLFLLIESFIPRWKEEIGRNLWKVCIVWMVLHHISDTLQKESRFLICPVTKMAVSYTLVQIQQPFRASLPSEGNTKILPRWLVPRNLIVTWILYSLDGKSHLKLQMEILFATCLPQYQILLTKISLTTLETFFSLAFLLFLRLHVRMSPLSPLISWGIVF